MAARALLVVCATVLGVGAAALGASAARADPQIGDPAPPLDLPVLAGAPQGARGPMVVDFFATWCGPCRASMAALEPVLATLDGRVSLVVVDTGEERAVVERFFATHPLPRGARVLLDPRGAASVRYGQRRLPTVFFVDEAGIIRHINRGFGPGYAARAERWLRALLSATVGAPKED